MTFNFKNADKIKKLNPQDVPWHFTPKTNDQKLFDLLTKLGFEKTQDNKKMIFKNGDEIFVYPQMELQRHHYMATRKHLDMNGRISKCDFDSIFNK